MSVSLVDTSVWLAAVFSTHPFHAQARQCLQLATPAEPAVLCRPTQQSFLRLASTPTLLKAYGATGLTNRDALIALAALMALPQVCERDEPPRRVRAVAAHRGARHRLAQGVDGCLSCRLRHQRWFAPGFTRS